MAFHSQLRATGVGFAYAVAGRRHLSFPRSAESESCSRCGALLAAGAVVCGGCQALVHSKTLEELAASARGHEARQELVAAYSDWQAALALLPLESSQAARVRTKLDELFRAIRQDVPPADPSPRWTRKLGPFAPVALLLLKGKFFLSLLKFKFLLSFAAFAGIYWALYGFRFGVGLAVLILVHELGHLVAVKRRGLAADLPMFIPGFGAYVRWNAAGVTSETRAFVSLAGPLAGAIGAIACALLWLQTRQGVWIALSSFSAFVNLMNLIPLWTLDGGQAMVAINRAGRIGIAIAAALFAAFFSQPLMLLVAGGAVYRAFEKDSAVLPVNRGVIAYVMILIATLGYLSSLAPLGAPR